MKRVLILLLLLCLLAQGFLCFKTVGVPVFVKEGDSVTLNTDIETGLQEEIRRYIDVIWTFNNYIPIAEIRGFRYVCTDVQCNERTERFRDRLKLDHQTGSLTITNTRNTDSGAYTLQLSNSAKIFIVAVYGFLGVSIDGESVFVMEGDSVTLNTNVKINQEKLRWYFNATLIAEISLDPSYNCTDVQCDDSNERFRDRLKLDHQTGSLTIMNTRNTDSGLYYRNEIYNSSDSDLSLGFGVAVHGVSAAERDEKTMSLKEGESVTLDPRVTNNPCNLMTWYLNDTRIDQSKICTDDQCKERFRDKLKLDHQTGALTITNIRTTDAGLYTVNFSNSCLRFVWNRRFRIFRSFSVSVTSLSSEFLVGLYVVAGVVAVSVLLIVASVAAVIYYWKLQESRKGSGMKRSDKVDDVEDSSPDQNDSINESSSNQTETLM